MESMDHNHGTDEGAIPHSTDDGNAASSTLSTATATPNGASFADHPVESDIGVSAVNLADAGPPIASAEHPMQQLEQQRAPCLSSGQEIDAKNTLQSHSQVVLGQASTAETTVPSGFYKQMHGIVVSPVVPSTALRPEPPTRTNAPATVAPTPPLPCSIDAGIATSVSSLSAPLEPIVVAANHAAPATVQAIPTDRAVPPSLLPLDSTPVFATACVLEEDDGCHGSDPTRLLPIQSISPDSMTHMGNVNSRISGLTDTTVLVGSPAKPSSLRRRSILVVLTMLAVPAFIIGTWCGSGNCSSTRSTRTAPETTNSVPTLSSIESTQLTSDFIQTLTLSGRKIAVLSSETSKQQLPEESALQWLLYNDPLSLQPINAANRFRLQQRFALQTIFFQRKSDQSSESLNITASTNECEWLGVACQTLEIEGEVRDVVTSIVLPPNQFAGSLPPDVGLLSAGLLHLNVSHNTLAGTIPESLDKCTHLETIDLSYNRGFVGTIPPSWGTLWTNMRHFSAAANDLTGSLPSELGNWTRLIHFNVQHNVLIGTIPPVFGEQWINLAHFDIGNSDMSEFDRLNRLTGTIPTTVALWTSLRHFNVGGNLLDGALPESLQRWTSLEFFDVFENDLIGTLPALGTTMLRHFDVNSNFFVGSLPATYTFWTNLEYFDVNDNQLTGTLSESLASWSNLRYLSLALNTLSGSLPEILGSSWPKLEELDIGVNFFSGTLPESIGDWTALISFKANDNDLTGSLPSSIGHWNLFSNMFNVDRNKLTGTLPDSIGQWSSVLYFSAAVNGLTGTIPASIENWANVDVAYFEANNFTGHVPDAICDTNITMLVADCLDEVTCSCCTKCNSTLDMNYYWG